MIFILLLYFVNYLLQSLSFIVYYNIAMRLDKKFVLIDNIAIS